MKTKKIKKSEKNTSLKGSLKNVKHKIKRVLENENKYMLIITGIFIAACLIFSIIFYLYY